MADDLQHVNTVLLDIGEFFVSAAKIFLCRPTSEASATTPTFGTRLPGVCLMQAPAVCGSTALLALIQPAGSVRLRDFC